MSDVPANNPINVTDLDKEFPVPGQDNDSQGFRDNFTVIDDNFVAAKARLEDLETNTVRVEADNTFLPLTTGGTTRLINPTLQGEKYVAVTIEPVEATPTTSNAIINFSAGAYQELTISEETILTVDDSSENLEGSGYLQKVTLHITAIGDTQNLKWDGDLTIKFDTASESFWKRGTTETSDILVDKVYLIELWTYQGSNTYYTKYIGEFE